MNFPNGFIMSLPMHVMLAFILGKTGVLPNVLPQGQIHYFLNTELLPPFDKKFSCQSILFDHLKEWILK